MKACFSEESSEKAGEGSSNACEIWQNAFMAWAWTIHLIMNDSSNNEWFIIHAQAMFDWACSSYAEFDWNVHEISKQKRI